MNCNETNYIENSNRCSHFLNKQKRYCKKTIFPNYNFCNTHNHHEKPLIELEKPEECTICLDEFEINEKPLKCGHWVHRQCIVKSGKNQCPICRFTVYLKPEEIKKCKEYHLAYKRSNVRDTNNIYLRALPQNMRQHIQEVGIDNIIDTHLNNNTRTFENMLLNYINQSLLALRS